MRHARLLAALALVVTACGAGAEDAEPVLASLCRARDATTVEAAATIFETDVHPPLHTLADEVAGTDRAVAARLLEAKYDVESVVRGDDPAPVALVQERLGNLHEHVRDALRALDRPAPDC